MSKGMVEAAGIRIITAQIAVYGEDGLLGGFLWVVAGKPAIAGVAGQDRTERPEGRIRQ